MNMDFPGKPPHGGPPPGQSGNNAQTWINRITRNGRQVKMPLVAIFMAVMIAIVSWFTINDVARRSSELNRLALESREEITNQLSTRVALEAEGMAMTLRSLTDLDELASLFLARDREALEEAAKSLYRDMTYSHRITHFSFTGPDRVNFLRVHNPSYHSDIIQRVTQLQAENSGRIASGLEMGASGMFTLRVVTPWIVDGQLIGYIEIGKEIQHIMDAIANDLGLLLIQLIDKSALDEELWKQFAKASGSQASWSRLPESIVVTPELFNDRIPALMELATGPTTRGPVTFLNEGYNFVGIVLPLRDMIDHQVGRIIAIRDISLETRSFEASLLMNILVAAAIAMACLLILGKIVGQIEQQVTSARDDLESTVAARTSELVATNEQLQEESRQRAKAQEKSDFFARILEDSWNEIYIFDDKTYRFIHVNRGALANMGYSLEEMQTLTAHGIKPDFTEETFSDAVQPLINGEKQFLIFEARHMRKNGSAYPVEVRLQYMRHETPPVFVAVINDISARKAAEAEIVELNSSLERRVEERTKELEETQETLVQSEKMASLGGLVAGVAHEVNTPLGISVTAVTHMSDALDRLSTVYEDGSITQEDLEQFIKTSGEATSIIEQNLGRASDLIRSFKLVSVDQSHDDFRLINIRDYLNDILLSLRPQTRKNQCRIHLECPEDIEVRTAPGALAQIVTNLVTNAIIHGFEGRKGGEIWLIADFDSKGSLRLSFKDNGVGIPPQLLKKVFDPFITSKRHQGSTGLGLHILHNLVTQKLKGTIQCQSSEGEGTVFEIRIPRSNLAETFDTVAADLI